MAAYRVVRANIRSILQMRGIVTRFNHFNSVPQIFLTPRRTIFRKSYAIVAKVMKERRKIAGPERVRRRSEWDNWNYKAELYAFSKRLQENISEETLRQAFIHDSYIKIEEQKRKDLDMPLQDVQLDLKSNSALISKGQDIMHNYLCKYLRNCFDLLPEEGILAVCEYLMSDEILSHVSYNIGTSELIFCAEYPPVESTLSDTFKAIVGSIAIDDSTPRAETFVLDFVCPQLIGKDIFEMWNLENPLDVLNHILEKHGRTKSESRLIFESGRNTIEAIYHIGLYSDKVFLGRGPGETLAIAEEMAAYDALRRLFHVNENHKPILFGENAKKCDLKPKPTNQMITEWYNEELACNV